MHDDPPDDGSFGCRPAFGPGFTGGSKGPALLLLLLAAGVFTERKARATWKQSAYLTAANAGDGDQLGFAIALSGDGNTLAAGAPMEASRGTGINGKGDDDSAYSSGAVYVYARSGTGWAQQAYLKASNTGSDDQFGNAVALSADGHTLAVSAVFEDSGATGINGNQADNSIEESGAVYVYTRTGTTWTQQAYVKASNTGGRDDGDTFGYTIALSDDGATLAVGAPSEDSSSVSNNANQGDDSAVGAGAVYVFTRAGASWSQQAYVKSPKQPREFSLWLLGRAERQRRHIGRWRVRRGRRQGRRARLHAQRERVGRAGATSVIERGAGNSFGSWVAIGDDGNTLAAGALDEDSLLTNVNGGDQGATDQSTDTSAGAAYVFTGTGIHGPSRPSSKPRIQGRKTGSAFAWH